MKDDDGSYFYLAKVKTTAARQWRGRLKFTAPTMVEIRLAHVRKDFSFVPSMFVGGLLGAKWRVLPFNETATPPKQAHDVAHKLATIAYEDQFRRRYLWRVMLGTSNGLRVSFPTDPIGAREAFRLRDIPSGANRRTALRHWVTQHWRKSRDGHDHEVREHLRGAIEFSWSGMQCRIEPSRFDLERSQCRRQNPT